MPEHRTARHCHCILTAGLLFAGSTVAQLRADDPATFATDHGTILRYDPIRQVTVPIPATELRFGYVYSHFSPASKRRVWSYVQADGTFWHAFGPGTTIEAPRFDLRGTRRELLEELDQTAPDLAKRIREGLRPIRFTLNDQDEWVEAGNSRVLSVFDADTGQRWEKHWAKYLPVRNLAGSRWAYDAGGYQPVATSLIASHPSAPCCTDR